MAADNTARLAGDYDYVIAGAGSAGCVLANRLSADPNTRVLLLEAGGRDNWIWFHIPVGYLFAMGNPRADWMFQTEKEPGLNGRALNYPRGKVIGGCSAINGMISMRGQSADYDHWRQLGLTGWGWDDVLPIFKRLDGHFLGDTEHHGGSGEWRVEQPRVRWDVLDAVIAAANEMGIPRTADFNTGDNNGVGYFHVNQKRGLRMSTARAFLKPVLNRPNLRLETGVLVEKVLVEGRRAAGVQFRQDGRSVEARARVEVVLSAGAVGSPQILQLSGIGPADWLSELGIGVVKDTPGAGRNLQDHLQQRAIFKVSGVKTLNTTYHSLVRRALMGMEYALLQKGPLTMAPSQLGIFTMSSSEHERANIEFHVQPLSLDKFGEPLHRFPAITVSACNLRPTSRGTIRLRSADPSAKPMIAPNYLSTPEDRRVAADAIRVTRRLMKQPALQPYHPEEYLPGPSVGDDDASLAKAAGDIGTTIFHPIGTAKMGLPSDPMAVVDERLRVMGLEGLRVVDASVMPSITSGNTNTPTIMIADKAAQMMIEDAKRVTSQSESGMMISKARMLLAALAVSLAAPAAAQTTLRVVAHSDLKILDPIWTTAFIVRNHGYMIYDTLFALDDKLQIKPQMVERWTVSDDKLTWTFTLRDGLEFHDGQPVTSDDVVPSLKRWAVRDSLGQILWTKVADLKALDPKTFQLVLKEPTGIVLQALSKPSGNPFIMPKRVAETPASEQIKEFVGSGPFIFKRDEWKPGDKTVYVKNPKYKPRAEPAGGLAGGKVAKVDRVEWLAMPDQQTAVNALAAGEIDIIEAPQHDLYPILKKDRNISMITTNKWGNQYIFRFNQLHKPFDNPKVRQAMLYALNQKDFLDAVIGDPEYYLVCKAMFMCGGPYETTAGFADKYESDFDKAKALLKEGGYDGTPVVLMHSTDLYVLTNMAPVAKSLMERAGMKVDMQSMDWQTLVSRRAKREPPAQGGWNLLITSTSGADALDPLTYSFIGATCDKAWFGWPCDAEITKLRDAFTNETDEARRKEIVEKIQLRAAENPTHAFLGQYNNAMAVRKNISGNVVSPVPVFWNIEKK